MLIKNNKYKILQIFFDDPIPQTIGFQLRELSRKAKIAPASVKNYLQELEMDGLIKKREHRIHGYPVYYANRENEKFRFIKKLDLISRILESGLLDYLNDICMPDVIILFGSAALGEDTKESDVDIYLLSKEKKLELKKFEKALNRKINVFFSESFNNLAKELRNNIINGVILKGYLKAF